MLNNQRAKMNKDPKKFKLYELIREGIVQISKSLNSPCFWATIEAHPLDENQVLVTPVNNGTFSVTGDLEVYLHKKA